MLGDLHANARDIEDLPWHIPSWLHILQQSATAPAASDFMNFYVGWIAYHAQRRALVSSLTAGFLVTAFPILCAELSLWSIRRRRLVAIVAVPVELCFKLFDPYLVSFDDSQKRFLQVLEQRYDCIGASSIGVENLLASDARKLSATLSHERDCFTFSKFPEYLTFVRFF
jgi:hypothetical protein